MAHASHTFTNFVEERCPGSKVPLAVQHAKIHHLLHLYLNVDVPEPSFPHSRMLMFQRYNSFSGVLNDRVTSLDSSA